MGRIWLILAPHLIFWAGALMNLAACDLNNGLMPVAIYQGTGYDDARPGEVLDLRHKAWGPDTHAKFLTDWILLWDKTVASPGDELIDLADWLEWPLFFVWLTLMWQDSSPQTGSTEERYEPVPKGYTPLPRRRNRQGF